jgi:hypothetical protein
VISGAPRGGGEDRSHLGRRPHDPHHRRRRRIPRPGLTPHAAAASGSRVRARAAAPPAQGGGALGAPGSASVPAAARAARASPHRRQSRRSVRPPATRRARPHPALRAGRAPPPRFLFPAGSPGPGAAGSRRPAHTCPASGGAGTGHARSPCRAPLHTLSRSLRRLATPAARPGEARDSQPALDGTDPLPLPRASHTQRHPMRPYATPTHSGLRTTISHLGFMVST